MEAIVNQILAQQEDINHKLLVDIRLFNGNILLRSFHITDLDPHGERIYGLTAQEEYSHAREGREPEYCILRFSEIKELNCPELELQYHAGVLA
ncbi:MAG: hypothetical protein ACJ75J_10350 [Cytophagaceae bacterium]